MLSQASARKACFAVHSAFHSSFLRWCLLGGDIGGSLRWECRRIRSAIWCLLGCWLGRLSRLRERRTGRVVVQFQKVIRHEALKPCPRGCKHIFLSRRTKKQGFKLICNYVAFWNCTTTLPVRLSRKRESRPSQQPSKHQIADLIRRHSYQREPPISPPSKHQFKNEEWKAVLHSKASLACRRLIEPRK